MEQSIKYFQLKKSDDILIYGKGGTAQTAQQVLDRMGFHNIHQLNRNEIQTNKTFQLLINCTPFGLNETDDPATLPLFKALIDLPYGKQTTTLVSKAIKDKLVYIDGFTFWKWQAKAQADLFGLEPEFKDYIDTLDLQALIQ